MLAMKFEMNNILCSNFSVVILEHVIILYNVSTRCFECMGFCGIPEQNSLGGVVCEPIK